MIAPRVWRALAVGTLVVTLLPVVAAGCGDDEPGPMGPSPTSPSSLPLASFTEWFALEPQNKQRGTFFYDESDRLVRYEFSHNGSGTWKTTIRVSYEYEGDRLVQLVQSIRPGEAWFANRHVAFTHDEQGRVIRAEAEVLNEGGPILTADTIVYRYEYNSNDQVAVQLVGDDERIEYTYDDLGNVVRIDSRDVTHLVLKFEYDETWNPFVHLPLQSGVNVLTTPVKFSLHNSVGFTVSEVGKPPASMRTTEVTANDDGLPVRKESTFWNTNDPEARTTIVAVFEYR